MNSCIVGNSVLQIFLVTGGRQSITTEILQDDKTWKVLNNGNLPLSRYGSVTGLQGLGLDTLNNEVYSFGEI